MIFEHRQCLLGGTDCGRVEERKQRKHTKQINHMGCFKRHSRHVGTNVCSGRRGPRINDSRSRERSERRDTVRMGIWSIPSVGAFPRALQEIMCKFVSTRTNL